MPKKDPQPCCSRSECYMVDAVVSVDNRGQMVLPKELRAALGIAPGDKLALVTRRQKGRPCCLLLVKADDLSEHVKGALGPLVNTMTKDG